MHGTNDAEFSILVVDKHQRHGIGTELLRRLVQVGRDEKLTHIVAEILPQNEGMKRVSAKLGFKLEMIQDLRIVYAQLDLTA